MYQNTQTSSLKSTKTKCTNKYILQLKPLVPSSRDSHAILTLALHRLHSATTPPPYSSIPRHPHVAPNAAPHSSNIAATQPSSSLHDTVRRPHAAVRAARSLHAALTPLPRRLNAPHSPHTAPTLLQRRCNTALTQLHSALTQLHTALTQPSRSPHCAACHATPIALCLTHCPHSAAMQQQLSPHAVLT